MTDTILVVNAGSSSIKCSLFATPAAPGLPLTLAYHADITGIGSQPRIVAKDANGNRLIQQELGPTANHEKALAVLLEWLETTEAGLNLIAVGHRVVHGGTVFTAPICLTTDIFQQLEQLIPLAPLHQPHNLAPIKILTQLKPALTQVACFDTAFHTTQPAVAQTFALPRALTAQGIKRYGFHGLSYEYIVHRLPHYFERVPPRLIVAHLGNGASLAAIKNGLSVATTMGLTALDGLPMGTRCGAIDPGVLLYLLNHGHNVDTLQHLLYHQSGLLGVSGISNDMQQLLNHPSPQAAEAIDLFVYRLKQEIGSMTAVLGGLDALIFTAGMGQHAATIRARVATETAWLGIKLDEEANQRHGPQISATESQVSVWVIPTDEEQMIAKHTYALTKI